MLTKPFPKKNEQPEPDAFPCIHEDGGFCTNQECWKNTKACRHAHRIDGSPRPKNVYCAHAL